MNRNLQDFSVHLFGYHKALIISVVSYNLVFLT